MIFNPFRLQFTNREGSPIASLTIHIQSFHGLLNIKNLNN